MSSNTIPNSDVNSPHTTQVNHNRLHNSPDDVRVVSQSQGDVNYIPQSPDEATPDNLHLLGTVCNNLLTDNSPLIQPAFVTKVPTPIIHSPTKAQLNDSVNKVLFASESCKKKRKGRAHITTFNNKKKRSNIPDISKALFWFLRDAKVKEKPKLLTTRHKYGTAYNHWITKKYGIYAPFSSLKSSLINAPCPLTKYHKRLILEEVFVLKEETEIICYIRAAHPWFKTQGKVRWIREVKAKLERNPMETLVLSGNVYFAFVMKVKRNIYCSQIVDRVISKAELKRGCTESEGWGIQVKVHNDQTRLVKFSNLLDHPDLIQFWMNGKDLPAT